MTSAPTVPPAAAPKTSGLAAASLVCGIAGLCTAGLGGIAGLCTGGLSGIVGLVLGFVALSKIKKSGGQMTGRGLAIAGTVVSAIILLIIVIAAARISAQIEQARISTAPILVAEIGCVLDIFNTHCGRYPTTAEGLKALVEQPAGLDGWRGPYLKASPPMDPWGNPLFYLCPGRHDPDTFDLFSAGPDGKPETDDDIGNWMPRGPLFGPRP